MDTLNPFSTRFLRPGANQYLFEEFSNSGEQIVELSHVRCQELVNTILCANEPQFSSKAVTRWSIIGPHGTGKSTLICCLIELVRERGIPIECVRLSTSQRHIKNGWKFQALARHGVYAIDGYEQLSPVSKSLVCVYARLLRQKLLITAHTSMLCFKPLYETKRTDLTEELVVRSLLKGSSVRADDLLRSTFWENSKSKHGQNLRESLFDAYDWYEKHILRL